MVKKRLIALVTIKEGWAVQSFGYGRYLPIGSPEIVIQNLDNWGADEIIIHSIDRSLKNLGPDLNLIRKIASLELGTPLIVGGGIKSLEDAKNVIKMGADRISLDLLLRLNFAEVRKISDALGAQCLLASLPLFIEKGHMKYFDYHSRKSSTVDCEMFKFLKQNFISECITIDCQNEGTLSGFDLEIIKQFPIKKIPLIPFGGIGNKSLLNKVLRLKQVAGVAIGNSLNYRENAIFKIKKLSSKVYLRHHKFFEELNHE